MKHTLATLSTTFSTPFISGTALADGGNGAFYGGHQIMWGNWLMGPMMMLIMLVIVIVTIVIILKAFGLGSNANANSDRQDSALKILNERFAKGEIDKAEYEERKSAVSS